MDVFFCTVAEDAERKKIAHRCLRWWETQDVTLRLLYAKTGKYEFQKQRRVYAESHADSPVYVLADDDCIPLNGVHEAVCMVASYPQFGMLSMLPENASIQPWTSGQDVFTDENVMEHVDVGGIRIIRQGVVKKWPEQTRPWYDREHSEAMRNSGFKVGYLRKFRMEHLGEGRTSLLTSKVAAL